jgi:hypothetical protein
MILHLIKHYRGDCVYYTVEYDKLYNSRSVSEEIPILNERTWKGTKNSNQNVSNRTYNKLCESV